MISYVAIAFEFERVRVSCPPGGLGKGIVAAGGSQQFGDGVRRNASSFRSANASAGLDIPACDLPRPSQPVKRLVRDLPYDGFVQFCTTVVPHTRAQYVPERRS
jgi:hypothetical protein